MDVCPKLLFAASMIAATALPLQAAEPASVPEAPPEAVAPPAAGPVLYSQERLEYGAYLALAGQCRACHTRDRGTPFAGGRAFETPFGTIYSSNITPSSDSGIGGFSDADFLRAMHQGIGPDGEPYYPAFPYPSFTRVSEDDVLAIKDYLFSLPPSEERPPANRLRWPFERRAALFGWQERYFEPGRLEPRPDKSAEWNRGAYLVEGLGHCRSCHTPRSADDPAAPADRLASVLVDGWYAPTLAPGLDAPAGGWTAEQLQTFLHTGVDKPSAGGGETAGVAPGPMADVVHGGLSLLALSDLRAMSVYLADSAGTAVDPAASAADNAAAEGRDLDERYCSSCHQPHGQGAAPYFPPLRGNPNVTDAAPDILVRAILLGAPAPGAEPYSVHVVMPSFGSILDDREIAVLATYIRTGWSNKAEPVPPELDGRLRATPTADAR